MSSAKFGQCFRDRPTLLKHIIRVGTTLRTATDCLAQEWQHLRARSTQGRLFSPAQHMPQLRVKTSTAEHDRWEWRELLQNGYILPQLRQSMIVIVNAK